MRIFSYILVLNIILYSCIQTVSQESDYYLIAPSDYLTGRFEPSKHELFVNLDKTDIPSARKKMYLRKETAAAFSLLLKDFKKEYPKINITIQSATRNFSSQKVIWEEKWSGKRKVAGIDLKTEPVKKAEIILQYSSMPGTSRHHWGTDFDINLLNNEYYKKGEGKVIYDWLVKNASRYGFVQAYNAGRETGYKEEKWHWSYVPLSNQFLKDWNKLYNEDPESFLLLLKFKGSEYAGYLAPVYVNSVNEECR